MRNMAERASNGQTEMLLRALKSLKRASKIAESSKEESLRREILFEKGLVNLSLGRADEAFEDITKSLENSCIETRFAESIAKSLTRKRINTPDCQPVVTTGRWQYRLPLITKIF